MKKYTQEMILSRLLFLPRILNSADTLGEKNHFIDLRTIWKGSYGRYSMFEEDIVLHKDQPNISSFKSSFLLFTNCFIQYQTNNDTTRK